VLHTPLCDLLGIEVPVIGAPYGPWDGVALAAAISNAGGLGSVGTAVRGAEELEEQWARLRSLTDRPFAVNHTNRPFREDAFAATLRARPAAISFHLAVAPELIDRAHHAGILWIQTTTDRAQAEAAVAAGADAIIAQGGEAGGHAGDVATMVIVPEVVDVAGDIPVVAAGGIADGRGLAAALALGAQGTCVGTRFLASEEMAVAREWKERIVAAGALDAVKVPNSDRVLPPFTLPCTPVAPRALRTETIEALTERPDTVDPAEAGPRMLAAVRDGGGHEHLPFTGQSAALVHEILPAAEIVRRLVAEAEAALVAAGRWAAPPNVNGLH
jgi:enoyl-[acyl-carrier protein] reductase II